MTKQQCFEAGFLPDDLDSVIGRKRHCLLGARWRERQLIRIQQHESVWERTSGSPQVSQLPDGKFESRERVAGSQQLNMQMNV